MAKIVITVEDNPDGSGVIVTSNPTFADMLRMIKSTQGSGLTSAHGYAMKALNEIREESKRQSPLYVPLPRVIT